MKVLIADPQPKVRHALSIWISGQPGWEVVGEAGDAFDLLNKLNQILPGVVILDRELPGLPIESLVSRMRLASQGVAIILLVSSPFERCQMEALDVDFYVSKVNPPNHMLDAILEARRRLEK